MFYIIRPEMMGHLDFDSEFLIYQWIVLTLTESKCPPMGKL